jgi:hypothetical protein
MQVFLSNDRKDFVLNAIIETITAARLFIAVHNVKLIGGRQTASPYTEMKVSAIANLPNDVFAPVSRVQAKRITPFIIRFTNSRISKYTVIGSEVLC